MSILTSAEQNQQEKHAKGGPKVSIKWTTDEKGGKV